jgi:flagellar motor switch protein FliN
MEQTLMPIKSPDESSGLMGTAQTTGNSGVSKGAAAGRTGSWNIDLLLDVELPIVVSFGTTEIPLKDVLRLGVGSVIELEKAVNDPVTITVNQKPIAKGEVVMVDGNYGVRILEVESTAERIRSLG